MRTAGDIRYQVTEAHRPKVGTTVWVRRNQLTDWTRVEVNGYGLRDGGFAVFCEVTTGQHTEWHKTTYHFLRRVPTARGLERVCEALGNLLDANVVTTRPDLTPGSYLKVLVPDYKGD